MNNENNIKVPILLNITQDYCSESRGDLLLVRHCAYKNPRLWSEYDFVNTE